MYNYVRSSKTLRSEGNDILKMTFEFPFFPSSPQISDFYKKLASNCEEWCENVEYPKLCRIIAENRKNGSHHPVSRYNYHFCATVGRLDEKTAEIKLDIRFFQNRSDPISSYFDVQNWSLEHGIIKKKKRKSI